MNVFDYMLKTFELNNFMDDEIEGDLKSMPLDSACGQDCKIAIDAARALINSIRKARGDHSESEAEIVYHTSYSCTVFING